MKDRTQSAGLDRVPPQAFFLVSAVFHYLGPSFAVLLFARVDVLGVAWFRIASAAAIFALWRRPWGTFLALDRGGKTLIVALGAVFALMNVCFYISIDRLPLATVAAIEFIGPIVLAAIGARTARNVAAVATAAAGVYLLTHVRLEGEPVGVAFAFANAALFTAYIVLAHRVARRSGLSGIDGLAAAMMLAFLFVSPIGLSSAADAFSDPVAIAAGLGKPMLILQGGRDYQVTVASDLGRWRTGLAGRPEADIRVYEADNHLFFPGTGPSTPARPRAYDANAPRPVTVPDPRGARPSG